MMAHDVDHEEYPGRLLHQAALWGNAELLEDLLNGDQVEFINVADMFGRTALHDAATNRDETCARVLLQTGANPNVACGSRAHAKTPLHVAAELGNVSTVKLLLDYGADVTARDAEGLTATDIAERAGFMDVVDLLHAAADEQEQQRQERFMGLWQACTSGDLEKTRQMIHELGSEAESVINSISGGSNTLLYKACEDGHTDIVNLLLEHGADGRFHPVTKYSPLYIACYYGWKDIVRILLQRFPELAQITTMEMWLPTHAAALSGHVNILELLLNFTYPSSIQQLFFDSSGKWEYSFPFDINASDVTGQTVLYIASCLGNQRFVESLLKFRVWAKRVLTAADDDEPVEKGGAGRPKTRIQSIMTRLNLVSGGDPPPREVQISPLTVDHYCNHQTETALHIAVKKKSYAIAAALLKAGASANLPIRDVRDEGVHSTALVEACSNRDGPMVDLLLRHGARDDDCRGLQVALASGDNDRLISKLLALKAHKDPEYKINKTALESLSGPLFAAKLLPNTPVMVNWHGQHCLTKLSEQWLIDASMVHNIKLKLSTQVRLPALGAVTRLDVSSNELEELPECIFQCLPSLHVLSASQNKLASLPDIAPDSCAVLEEIHLQDNRLDGVPAKLFFLPSLQLLDLSNNKVQCLPVDIWSAPRLRDLNLSMNLLCVLPSYAPTRMKQKADVKQTTGVSTPRTEGARNGGEGVAVPYTRQELVHHTLWNGVLEVVDAALEDTGQQDKQSQLSNLNLAHNAFESVPPMLACNAPQLARLNLSYNRLSGMGPVTSYPNGLRHLDLSCNQIASWPTSRNAEAVQACYVAQAEPLSQNKSSPKSVAAKKNRCQSCPHRRHYRMENLRTLVLANNKLTSLQLTTDDDDADDRQSTDAADSKSEFTAFTPQETTPLKARIQFPNLSMLDVSNNELTEVPVMLSELTGLSVLNLSGNPGIVQLPPELGLLNKVWNLNLRGCSLQDPLRSMIESRKYKTTDIVGYLKSILEDAKPYARMKLMIVGVQGIGKTSLLEQLRQEGTGSYRRKPPEHWGKRMGNKNLNLKTPKGVSLSTVGVDVGDWIYEKKTRGQPSFGPVTFRTWDFGGQREYYSTHQYFLSKRSLYLVVWRITDGERGVKGIHQWLINIQARAANAPVLIIGTHQDLVKETFPASYSEDLQHLIREKFINVVDADKCGLPRVLDTVEISCKTKHNIKHLCNLIYDVVFDLRCPGSKERLLEQRIPATYLALEDVVGYLAIERRLQAKDPVLHSEQYRMLVMHEMQQKFNILFRDMAELNQATAFLHDNGVLLHYEDATLKDLYFLDPQWLCDMLAHVVTIREINPFARNGIMRIDDLKHVFKSSQCAPADAQTYILSLLNKFEVALTWDGRTLLIPSMLPSEELLRCGLPGADVRVPIRSRSWGLRSKSLQGSACRSVPSSTSPSSLSLNLPSKSPISHRPGIAVLCGADSPNTPTDPSSLTDRLPAPPPPFSLTPVASDSEHPPIQRLLVLSYLPSGFWPRLITRILADDLVVEALRSYIIPPRGSEKDPNLMSALSRRAEWVCWQTGLELRYLDTTLLKLREVMPHLSGSELFASQLMVKIEGNWSRVDTSGAVLIEVVVPCSRLQASTSSLILEPSSESTAKLLTLAVDHIDTLLEDWYPTLGTRFVHTSEGRFLVTRLVPCPECVTRLVAKEGGRNGQGKDADLWQLVERAGIGEFRLSALTTTGQGRGSKGSTDSGVCADSQSSSRKASAEGDIDSLTSSCNNNSSSRNPPPEETVYGFMVEECILSGYEKKLVTCPDHGDLHLAKISPDMVFMDLGERFLINSDHIKKGKMLGRGAFGFVFRAGMKQRGSGNYIDVAMKMLQPVDPGYGARHSDTIAFKAAWNKWQRDPLQYACKAYCTARQELNILLSLRHPHIVPLVGVCTQPLALVLHLATLGALDGILRNYRRSGTHLELSSLQRVILQVAKALEYLHQQHIIYRDLKSENVLVWEFPAPFQAEPATVDVKLADYGISRSTLPTGTKGFGGTEGFMAPEIMRYNGEEEYTEKVDCFSFGMFMYELLTLRLPFEGHDCVKDHILDGGRPVFTSREITYPAYMMDLMIACWSQQPRDRPSASQIVSIASAPEFTRLLDVVSLQSNEAVLCTGVTALPSEEDTNCELWLGKMDRHLDILVCNCSNWTELKVLPVDNITVTCLCVVNDAVWLGDSRTVIRIYGSQTYTEIASFSLCPDSPIVSAVRSMHHLASAGRVAIATNGGQVWLCPDNVLTGEGLQELATTGTSVFCLCGVDLPEARCELWCGQAQGAVSVYTIQGSIVSGQEVVNHSDPPMDTLDVSLLCSSSEDVPTMWSYVYPGCVVYQWDCASRTIVHRLDCSKLAPCSESLLSISIEEHLSPGRCQVTAMAVLENELYVGTTWGCIIVAESHTMRPITVFRPFEEEVKAILPLPAKQNPAATLSTEPPVPPPQGTSATLATVGKGYRNLIGRYLPTGCSIDYVQQSMYVLLWRADSWMDA
ncbi:leucine-rich repeat serine/threonine-protein kinase 1-like isoform X2 [Ornithodoros turicata]|uniref:leucine-rich repeat serine/threonine-protein kinase 1-like isoform X2 n=1 Tax=Ornithodoros turicata TaxID=34597 RepID=UPI0031393C27